MRLPAMEGEWIDRSRSVEFSFEGRTYRAFGGDTVSTALWANDRTLLGRSFKYHRPRGILSLANHDMNNVAQWGPMPNLRMDVTPVQPGMVLTAVNTFGSLESDKAAVLGAFSRFLPVGFYYKAFYSKKLFPLWEKMFRTLTGLGKVDVTAPRRYSPKCYGFCDVLVVGAGPSGMAAALSAADQGADVVLVDENARAGGSATYEFGADSERVRQGRELLAKVSAHSRIRVMTATYAAGYYADQWVPLVDGDKITKMRSKAVVVAAGGFEQPAVFRYNDLPGIMLASAAQRLLYRYAVKPMQRAVVLTANGAGYRAALDLAAHGVQVAAVVDLRPHYGNPALVQQVKALGIPVHAATCIAEAVPTGDHKALKAVRLAAFDDGRAGTPVAEIPCDGVAVSVGWAPAANLLYQAGTRMAYRETLHQFVPDVLPEGVFACGKVNGVHDWSARLLDGERAGSAAAAHAGFGSPRPVTVPPETECPSHPWPMVAHPKGKNFVDFDEDIQFQDFPNAVQEGFDNIELLKRYSTVGMGPSQGKHSNMNALRILARLTGKKPQEVGTTTARPFFHPVPMAHLGGRGFHPERQTPLQARHDALGAVWMPAGVWQRPEYYARDGKSRITCIREEALAVRNGVGLIDVGTLGKLEVRGPDAAAFLERAYVSRYAGLKVGMTRYAVMCDESGVVIDDGVVARLAEDHFYFTTTTSGAAGIYRELSRLALEWQMDCGLVNVTGAYAGINLAGPRSRQVLAQLTDLDLSAAAFPYLGIREGRVAGIPARLMRVGFVGEWGYEIHVPASQAGALWDALLAAGADQNIRPFGVEAQRLLRLEKGHIIIGQDTDGLTTANEAALDWAVKLDKPFFIGQRSLQAEARKHPRKRLIGFVIPGGPEARVPQECHLFIREGEIVGRVTSIAWSPTLKGFVGLALVRPDLAKPGLALEARLSDGAGVTVQTAATPFYDPENLRQKEA